MAIYCAFRKHVVYLGTFEPLVAVSAFALLAHHGRSGPFMPLVAVKANALLCPLWLFKAYALS